MYINHLTYYSFSPHYHKLYLFLFQFNNNNANKTHYNHSKKNPLIILGMLWIKFNTRLHELTNSIAPKKDETPQYLPNQSKSWKLKEKKLVIIPIM